MPPSYHLPVTSRMVRWLFPFWTTPFYVAVMIWAPVPNSVKVFGTLMYLPGVALLAVACLVILGDPGCPVCGAREVPTWHGREFACGWDSRRRQCANRLEVRVEEARAAVCQAEADLQQIRAEVERRRWPPKFVPKDPAARSLLSPRQSPSRCPGASPRDP